MQRCGQLNTLSTLLLNSQAQAQPNSGGGTHSVFGRLSGALHNDRGQNAKPGASPPREGGHGPGAQFAELRTRLSNRFRSASSSEPPPPDE